MTRGAAPAGYFSPVPDEPPVERTPMADEWEAEFQEAFDDDDDDDAQADGYAEEHLLLEEPPDDFECDFGIPARSNPKGAALTRWLQSWQAAGRGNIYIYKPAVTS